MVAYDCVRQRAGDSAKVEECVPNSHGVLSLPPKKNITIDKLETYPYYACSPRLAQPLALSPKCLGHSYTKEMRLGFPSGGLRDGSVVRSTSCSSKGS